MNRFLILGTGQQGHYIAKLIAGDFQLKNTKVVVAGVDKEQGKRIEDAHGDRSVLTYQYFDVSQCESDHRHQLGMWMKGFDVVVGAVPSHLGQLPLALAVEYGVHYVDLSFTMLHPGERQRLDTLARINKSTVLLDCGLAPGLPNMVVGNMLAGLPPGSTLDDLKIYVGGVALQSDKSNGYVTTWSLEDLYEEYVRPGRFVENGKIMEIAPLAPANREAITFKDYSECTTLSNVPTHYELEAFTSDGLRSLLDLKRIVPNMVEKTLRWPGHMDFVRSKLIRVNSSFMETKPVAVEIFKQLFAVGGSSDDHRDLVIMMIKSGKTVYRLCVKGTRHVNAMTKTTAGTCAAVAVQLADMYRLKEDNKIPTGVMAPEVFYCNTFRFDELMSKLKLYGIVLIKSKES